MKNYRRLFLLSIAPIVATLIGMSSLQPAAGQIPKASVDALKSTLLKRQLMPRGFSADPVVHFSWNGNSLDLTPPSIHTLAVFTIASIGTHANKIQIHGSRRTLLRKNETEFSISGTWTDQDIEIDLKGADIATIMPRLPNLIFFHDGGEALTALPLGFREFLPAKTSNDCCGNADTDKFKACDCAKLGNAACGEIPLPEMVGMKGPQIKPNSVGDVEDSAGRSLIGDTAIGLKVEKNGRPSEVWIFNPGTAGLSVQTAKSFKEATLIPATCHDVPVAIVIAIAIHSEFFDSGISRNQ